MDDTVKTKPGLARSARFNGLFSDDPEERTSFSDLLAGDRKS